MATFSARQKSKVCSARWTAARRTSIADAASSRDPASRQDLAVRLQAARARRQGADAARCRRCTRASAAISARPSRHCCGRSSKLKLTSVDQLTYSEFVFSLENPTCFNLINAAPLEGQLILDINLSLLFPIIDRLLGGGSDPTPPDPPAADRNRAAARLADHRSVLRGDEARLGKRARAEPLDRPRGEQSATGADRAAERSGRADQLRAHAGRRPRHDEPVHPVQLDRADQQRGCRPTVGSATARSRPRRKASSGSAAS